MEQSGHTSHVSELLLGMSFLKMTCLNTFPPTEPCLRVIRSDSVYFGLLQQQRKSPERFPLKAFCCVVGRIRSTKTWCCFLRCLTLPDYLHSLQWFRTVFHLSSARLLPPQTQDVCFLTKVKTGVKYNPPSLLSTQSSLFPVYDIYKIP